MAQAWKKSTPDEVSSGRNEVQTRVPLLKLQSGAEGKFRRNRLRILPPRADYARNKYYHYVGIHYVGQKPVQCPEFHHARYCVVCAASKELYRSGDQTKSKDLSVKYYALMNAVKVLPDGRALKVNDEGIVSNEPSRVEVLQLPKNTFDELLDEVDNQGGPSSCPIDDPEDGNVVIIKKKGEMDRTRYEVVVEPTSIFNNGDFNLLNNMHDLTQVYPDLEDEALERLLTAPTERKALPAAVWDDDEDAEEKSVEGTYRVVPEEEDAPAPKKEKAPKPTVSSEEGEAAKARLKALSATQPVASDDDDEDDDDD